MRALGVGSAALLGLVILQVIGHGLGLSDEALRLTAIASLVVGNLLMLQWFRGHFRHAVRINVAFEALLFGVCGLTLIALTLPRLNEAFGFPASPGVRWVLLALSVPMAWSAWQLVKARQRAA